MPRKTVSIFLYGIQLPSGHGLTNANIYINYIAAKVNRTLIL